MPSDVCAARDVTALILAAGEGQRLGGKPKAFIDYQQQTFLAHAITSVRPWAERIVVGVRESDLARARSSIAQLPEASIVTCIAGGHTRQESLERILTCAMSRYILLHEVARPWTQPDDFRNLLKAVQDHVAVALYTKVAERDTVAVMDGAKLGALLPRASIVTLQTPHAYERSVLVAAYAAAAQGGWSESSTAALVQRAGFPVHLVEGSAGNLKVTYPQDLPLPRASAQAS